MIKLTGECKLSAQKSQAENLAKGAAPTNTIANEIGVRPPGAESQAGQVASSLDNGIEGNFKATLKAHKNLDDQSINFSAKNGTSVLKGSVKTAAQKREAGELAKQVPNVEQVVNEIEIKPDKHSTIVPSMKSLVDCRLIEIRRELSNRHLLAKSDQRFRRHFSRPRQHIW